jgi:hypothetical protein
MKGMICAAAFFSTTLASLIPAHSQCPNGTCGTPYVNDQTCKGPNNCSQTVVLREPSGAPPFDCYSPTYVWCCNEQLPDFGVGGGFDCDNHSYIPKKELLEFAMTHTVWRTDCSGHVGPFAVSWTAPDKPIRLRPRIALN